MTRTRNIIASLGVNSGSQPITNFSFAALFSADRHGGAPSWWCPLFNPPHSGKALPRWLNLPARLPTPCPSVRGDSGSRETSYRPRRVQCHPFLATTAARDFGVVPVTERPACPSSWTCHSGGILHAVVIKKVFFTMEFVDFAFISRARRNGCHEITARETKVVTTIMHLQLRRGRLTVVLRMRNPSIARHLHLLMIYLLVPPV